MPEKEVHVFVPVIGQMNLRNCFSMQIILCLILQCSFSVLGRAKKQERVWDFGSIRNALPRKDMRFMIPVRREAEWVPQELSGMKHLRKPGTSGFTGWSSFSYLCEQDSDDLETTLVSVKKHLEIWFPE